MKIVERMFDLMKKNDIKDIDLARHLNISKSVVSSWKKRNTNPPSEYVEQICVLLDIPIEFLITGKITEANNSLSYSIVDIDVLSLKIKELSNHSKSHLKEYVDYLTFKEEKTEQVQEKSPTYEPDLSKKITPLFVAAQEEIYREIPCKGVVAAGGPIDLPDDYSFTDMVSVPDSKNTKNADFALRVKGDSMEPDIQDGEIILVKMQGEAHNGQIVVASIDDAATLKKVYRYPDRIELHAINQKYPPIIIDSELTEFRVIGIML